jgi:hypothetical protein
MCSYTAFGKRMQPAEVYTIAPREVRQMGNDDVRETPR